jgi:hypothetical protein
MQQAMEEFSGVVATSVTSALGGLPYAQRTLEIAKGDYKASSIIGRVGPSGTSVEVIKDISEMEGRQIFNLIKQEQPQTISFVLSYLDPAKSAEVFALLSPDLREEVIERLGTIESTSLELVGKIARSLGKHFDTKVRPAFHRSGGVRAVATLLLADHEEQAEIVEPFGAQLQGREDLRGDQTLGIAGAASLDAIPEVLRGQVRRHAVHVRGQRHQRIAHADDHVEAPLRHYLPFDREARALERRCDGLAHRPLLPGGRRDVDEGAQERERVREGQGHGGKPTFKIRSA